MKKDYSFALVVGLVIGVIWTAIFVRLGTLNFLHLGRAIWFLVLIVPLGTVFGIYVGNALSRWKTVFSSLVRFGIVGVLNTGIDLGIFNLFIYFTDIVIGRELGVFKGISFAVAASNSYFFNKYWTFNAGNTENQGSEFAKYAVVTLIGFSLNVGITYFVANKVSLMFGFTQLSWDSIAAMLATGCSLIWNFLGYRLLVFKQVSKIQSL